MFDEESVLSGGGVGGVRTGALPVNVDVGIVHLELGPGLGRQASCPSRESHLVLTVSRG